MTEKLKQGVNIPVWVLTGLVTLLLSLGTYTITRATTQGAMFRQIEINTGVIKEQAATIKTLETSKVNKDEFQRVWDTLVRIEGKLDAHTTQR